MDATEIPSTTSIVGEKDHVGLCDRPECIRTRALLARRPPIEYKTIEEVRLRNGHVSWWWICALLTSLAWCVACIQKDRPVLAVLNFFLAFLPLWRQLYVDTAWRWTIIALTVMVGTFYAL